MLCFHAQHTCEMPHCCRLRHIHRLNYWPLHRVLEEKYKLPPEEVCHEVSTVILCIYPVLRHCCVCPAMRINLFMHVRLLIGHGHEYKLSF